MSSLPRIGVVGTGRMGANMARRLAECGYAITALYDARAESARELARELGSTSMRGLADVTAASDTVFTVVSDDAAMYAIFAESGDSLLRDPAGTTFVNCATVSPSVHVEIERRAEARDAHALEACMASSIPQARNGTLYLMVAGRREVYEHVKPVLDALSSSVRYIGAAGRAAQVKALVNMVMNVNTAGLAEGLGLGDALGLDLTMLREVFGQTGANSRVLETDGEDMQNREHEVFFSAEHAAKDARIALDLAARAGATLPMAAAMYHQFERMNALGLGSLDKSGISELTFPSRTATGIRTS